jgi:hypothetical protein
MHSPTTLKMLGDDAEVGRGGRLALPLPGAPPGTIFDIGKPDHEDPIRIDTLLIDPAGRRVEVRRPRGAAMRSRGRRRHLPDGAEATVKEVLGVPRKSCCCWSVGRDNC